MQITIELPPDLEQDLIHQAAQSNLPLQALVLQALRQVTQSSSGISQWSDVIIAYEGIPDFLGIGVHKGGTSWLAKQLQTHPEI